MEITSALRWGIKNKRRTQPAPRLAIAGSHDLLWFQVDDPSRSPPLVPLGRRVGARRIVKIKKLKMMKMNSWDSIDRWK